MNPITTTYFSSAICINWWSWYTGGSAFQDPWCWIRSIPDWPGNIDLVSSRLSSVIGVIYECKNYLTFKWLMYLSNAYFLPHVKYCNIVWGSAAHSHVNKINLLQWRILKLILGVEKRTSTNFVLSRTKVLTINRIHEKQLIILVYKSFNELLPSVLSNLFIRQQDIINNSR